MSLYICPTHRVSYVLTKECTKVSYVLWVVMICHCRFINCNKCTALLRDVDDSISRACMVAGDIVHGKSLVLSAQYYFEPKTALKNKNLKKNKLSNDLLS